GPGTHVLIIGIGQYPYLMGGANENPKIAEGMGQLDAPPISARALAKWFLENFKNSERPLASLALVLSDPESARFKHRRTTEGAHNLPKGTADDVQNAIHAWLKRASLNGENLTIFFFSGHGVSASESLLLLRDFGARAQNRFDGALNLEDFRVAMETMLPEYQ